MELWGLTGGIACGKSTVSGMLAQRGAVIVDADQLARDVVAPGQPAWTALVEAFGPSALAPDGQIDRKYLGTLIFGDNDARARLNAITHPAIAVLAAQRTAQAQAGGAAVCIYDAPLLVENGLHHGLREVLVVTAQPQTQLQRLVQRDGLTPAQAQARMDAQMPVAEKARVATHVFANDGALADLEAQVAAFWTATAPRLEPAPGPA